MSLNTPYQTVVWGPLFIKSLSLVRNNSPGLRPLARDSTQTQGRQEYLRQLYFLLPTAFLVQRTITPSLPVMHGVWWLHVVVLLHTPLEHSQDSFPSNSYSRLLLLLVQGRLKSRVRMCNPRSHQASVIHHASSYVSHGLRGVLGPSRRYTAKYYIDGWII